MALASSTYDGSSGMPTHVAIIMDGNGRWAKARGLPRIAGHRKGVEAVRTATKTCMDLGVEYLTIYAFSAENWKRPLREVDDLMGLLRLYIRRELNELRRNGVQLHFIGDRSRLSNDIRKLLQEAETETAVNRRLIFTVAVNYGGRQEILEAVQGIARDAKDGALEPSDITEAVFERYLQSVDVPDPDLLIRTSGEQRLSNFLLWQSAYTELAFTSTLWPDFTRQCLEDAISDYQKRERRYGGTG